MIDQRDRIVEIMKLFLVHEQRSKDKVAPFKVKAYQNAINSVQSYNNPITTVDDVDKLEKIGKKIRLKMYEIVLTGDLEEASGLKSITEIREELMSIYGIGSVKADDLIDNYGVESITDLVRLLRDDPDILTTAQTLGLVYREDLIQRIPRREITQMEQILKKFFNENAPEFRLTITGSYRRGFLNSGDIDVLLTYTPNISYKDARVKFEQAIDELINLGYIVGVLAKGQTKLLSIIQLPGHPLARRMDILLTQPEELACAFLYFTGSKEFNEQFRKVALMRGYTLNEHRLKKLNEKLPIPDVPIFYEEKDIFDFLRIIYQSPEERIGPVELQDL
jgi:DNA polymerase/3'-5' exonuclease PolX